LGFGFERTIQFHSKVQFRLKFSFVGSAEAVTREMFKFEDYTLDVVRGCLRTADREIELRAKSFEMLRHPVENAGRLVSKSELIKIAWPNVVVSDESLSQCISDVRQAIGDSGQNIIKTIPPPRLSVRCTCLAVRDGYR
jgi:DNA-binding response OmpR family regulator